MLWEKYDARYVIYGTCIADEMGKGNGKTRCMAISIRSERCSKSRLDVNVDEQDKYDEKTVQRRTDEVTARWVRM